MTKIREARMVLADYNREKSKKGTAMSKFYVSVHGSRTVVGQQTVEHLATVPCPLLDQYGGPKGLVEADNTSKLFFDFADDVAEKVSRHAHSKLNQYEYLYLSVSRVDEDGVNEADFSAGFPKTPDVAEHLEEGHNPDCRTGVDRWVRDNLFYLVRLAAVKP